ncbi:THO complex subunit 2 [Ceratobasidium sp. 394]|nr:THO complex subunit 2 [Ceratobasidium sp. 394]
MSSIIFTCSEREARNYGRFLRGVLTDVGAWAKDEKTYKADVVDKLLPTFLRQWTRTLAMSRNIKASDMIPWDNIRRLVSKWHIKMFKSCVDCLLSGEAMHIRNAIIVLTEVLPVFPMKEISHNSGPAIINAVRELLEKETRPDLFNMTQSYHGQLNSRRSQWEAEVRDAGAARTQAVAPVPKPSTVPSIKPAEPTPPIPSAKPATAVAVNGAKNSMPEPRPASPKDVEMAVPPSAPLPAPVVPVSIVAPGATTDSADANTKSYVDSLPKPSVVKGRVQRDPSAVSTPPPSSHEPPQPPQPNAIPTEPRRPTPSAPRLDLAKLNGLESAKSQPSAVQLSARSSRPPTPTGPRKHGLDSPRPGRASMPVPVEPSSTPAAQELRKFSAEKAAEKSAAAAMAAAVAVAPSDRTPSRMSSIDDRRSPSPRPSRRNGSADSRTSERTRDKARDRDRERHDDRDRERDRDKEKEKDRDRDRGDRDRERDRDRRYGRSKRGAERDKEKEKDKDYRKRSGDGSHGRGYDDDDEGSVKRHKSSNDEKKRDDRDRHHRDRDKERDKDKHRPREKEHRDRSDRDRDRGRSDKDRERREERDLGKEKDKERDRPSGRDRDRDREQKDRDREREKEREGDRGRSRRSSRMEDTLPADQAPSNEFTFKPPADPPTGPKHTQSSFPTGLPPKPQPSEIQREPSRSFEPHGRSFDQGQNSLIARLSQSDQPSTGPSVPQKRGAAEDTGPRGNDRPSKRPQTGFGSGGRGGGMFGAAIQGMRGQGGNRPTRE